MAWTTPMTAVANSVLTAAQWNAQVRDNLLETAVAKATTSGSYYASSGANTLAERTPATQAVSATESTTSTAYTDLATLGPEVTVTSGARCLVGTSGAILSNTANADAYLGMQISGATTFSATDSAALIHTSATANARVHASLVIMYNTTAGSNTFTCKYKTQSGTASFGVRRIFVLPF